MSAKIEIDSLCNACLSMDRKLRSMKDLPEPMEWEVLGLSIEYGAVCWECEAIMKKYVLFKKNVVKAQTFLFSNDLNKPVICLSTLRECYDTHVTNAVKIETDLHDADMEYKGSNEDDIEIDRDGVQMEKIFVMEREANVEDERSEDDKRLYKRNFTSQPMSLEELHRMRERDRHVSKFQKAAHKCASCVLVFYKRKELERHKDLCHNLSAGNECGVCNCRFDSSELLNNHFSEHKVQYCCNLCPYKHYSVHSMEEHMQRNHDKDTYRCHKCEQVFSSKRSQKNHLYTAHGDPCACDICGKVMKSRINLKQHIRITHEQRMFDCEVCKMKFRGRKRLQYHMLSHCRREKELSYCAECDVQFGNRYKYRIHLKGNKHIQPQCECPHCERKFTNKNYVERHIAIVHLNQLDYSCDMCDKKFSTAGNLKIHLERRHEGKSVEKKHQCTICTKTFTTKYGLQGHLNSHTGERPFKCDRCDKSFSQNGGLYKHKQRVHKVVRLRDVNKLLNIQNV